jgi:hypothetical protein
MAAKKMGRPSKRTPQIIDEICERIAKGETLSSICRDDKMPSRQKLYEWQDADSELSGRIARAREDGFDAIAEECLAIADETQHDTIKADSGDRQDSEWISRSRLRVDTRLKLLAKWSPKKYGDKIEHQHGELAVSVRIGGNA